MFGRLIMPGLDNRGIDEILLEMGVISIADFKKALEYKRKTNKEIEKILLALKLVTREDILKATAEKFGVKFIDLDKFANIDKTLLSKVSKNLMIRYNVLPLKMGNGLLYVAMSDPGNQYAIDDLKLTTGFEIKPVLCHEEKIKNRIEKLLNQEKGPSRDSSEKSTEDLLADEEKYKAKESEVGKKLSAGIRESKTIVDKTSAENPPIKKSPQKEDRLKRDQGFSPDQTVENKGSLREEKTEDASKTIGKKESSLEEMNNQKPSSMVESIKKSKIISPIKQEEKILTKPLDDDSIEDEFDSLFSGFEKNDNEQEGLESFDDEEEFDVLKSFQADLSNDFGADFNDSYFEEDSTELEEMYEQFDHDEDDKAISKNATIEDHETKDSLRESHDLLEEEETEWKDEAPTFNIKKDLSIKEVNNTNAMKKEILDLEKEQEELSKFDFGFGMDGEDDDVKEDDLEEDDLEEDFQDAYGESLGESERVHDSSQDDNGTEREYPRDSNDFEGDRNIDFSDDDLDQEDDIFSDEEFSSPEGLLGKEIFEQEEESGEFSIGNEEEDFSFDFDKKAENFPLKDEEENDEIESMIRKNMGGGGESKVDTYVDYDVGIDQKPLFKEKLGNFLVKSGVITDVQLEEALSAQKKTGQLLGKVLVKNGYIKRKTLYSFLEKQLGVRYIDLESIEIQPLLLNLVKEEIARQHSLVPFAREGEVLKVAMSDPLNIFSIDDLRIATGLEIQPFLADDEQIRDYIDIHYEKAKGTQETFNKRKELDTLDQAFQKVNEEIAFESAGEDQMVGDSFESNNVVDAPIVKMVNIIFQGAVARRASDIHIEAHEDEVLVRYRIDGELVEVMKQDTKTLPALVARIKIISGLNIAEKRIPQDGRITVKINQKPYDMRVSILPTMFGEKVVIRIADKEGFNVSKTQLGFFGDDLKKFENILQNPHGIVLVTGPTGSGKSTTLYTSLRELSKPNVNILTVEDPVESTVKGVNQVQVNVKAGLTFATALRSFLRQDPDIIMVGEIRDGETAEIAVRAAITGHLVLSTLHTNDAPSTINRIIDMGIEPYLISSSVVGVIAQRLVRRLCKKCKREKVPSLNERSVLELRDGEDIKIFEAVGCDDCNQVGYKGRIAVHEVMTMNRELHDMITQNATADELKDVAVKNGMKTLKDNCIRLIKGGVTSVDELLGVVHSDI
jgi:type IV pilus assembly protein PilB